MNTSEPKLAGNRFPTTRWSLVLTAGTDGAQAKEALNQLCLDYWRPLFHYLRRSGYSVHDAEDLTQQFLTELLARNGLSRLDPARGRFRSFLLVSLRNFLSHQRERKNAWKRGGGQPPLPLEAADREQAAEPAAGLSPEALYDRQWGLTVLERARQRLEGEYIAAGKKARFVLLREFLPGGTPSLSQAEIAEILGTSVSAVKSEIYRLRQRFGQYLRAEIAQTVPSPAEIDSEIRQLLVLFSGGTI